MIRGTVLAPDQVHGMHPVSVVIFTFVDRACLILLFPRCLVIYGPLQGQSGEGEALAGVELAVLIWL